MMMIASVTFRTPEAAVRLAGYMRHPENVFAFTRHAPNDYLARWIQLAKLLEMESVSEIRVAIVGLDNSMARSVGADWFHEAGIVVVDLGTVEKPTQEAGP